MNNMKVKFKSRLLISFLLVSLVFSGCQNLSEISDKYSTSSAGYESSVQDDSSESSSNSKNNALSGKSGLTHTSYNGEPDGIIKRKARRYLKITVNLTVLEDVVLHLPIYVRNLCRLQNEQV